MSFLIAALESYPIIHFLSITLIIYQLCGSNAMFKSGHCHCDLRDKKHAKVFLQQIGNARDNDEIHMQR